MRKLLKKQGFAPEMLVTDRSKSRMRRSFGNYSCRRGLITFQA